MYINLKMVKNSKIKYYFDDKILKLKKYRGKAFIKVLGIPIKVSKKYYSSVYGPTSKIKQVFSLLEQVHYTRLELWSNGGNE